MAELVIAAAGSAIGGSIGGSFLGISAASWGWMAGSLLASAIFKPPGQQGPRLDDRTIVGTEYGQAIPWVAGSPRLAGQVAWITNPIREIANTQKVGKGGGQKVTTYTYECDLLILLTENVTDDVARDWLNGELVRAGLTLKDGIWDSVTIYTGADDQLPFPPYEAAVGVGNAPAFRGRTTIGITGLKLGGGKQLPNLEHQISKSNVVIDDRIRLLTSFAGASSEDLSAYAIGPGARTNGSLLGEVFRCDWNSAANNVLSWQDAGLEGVSSAPVTYEVLFQVQQNNSLSQIDILRFKKGSPSNPDYVFSLGVASGTAGGAASFIEEGPGLGSSSPIAFTDSVSAVSRGLIHLALIVYPDDTASVYWCGTRVANRVAFDNNSTTTTGLVTLGGNAGATRDMIVDFSAVRVARAEVYTGASITPPTDLDGDLTNSGAVVTQGTVQMDELASSLMLRAGYNASEFDVSALADLSCHGYSTGDVTSTRAHLETLRAFGQYEANCSDKIYIFPRATEPAGAIPWADLGASESHDGGGDPFALNFGNETELPAQIALRYRNVAADWNVGTELSDRLHSSQQSTQVAEMPFGMTPAQAKSTVDGMLKDAMASLGRVTIKVGGRKHAKYEPGDIVTVTDPTGRLYRLRILTKRDSVFLIEFECVLDDASALVSPAITYEGYVSTDTPLRVAPTDYEVMSLRPLRDADALDPGPYVAVTPSRTSTSDEWPGAVFVRARLPGDYEQQFISGDACVIGECLTTLGSYAKGSAGVQREGRLRVKVMGDLASTTWADLMADRTLNAALVGDEPIRFQHAEFIENDGLFKVYDLSVFLRGQLGEEGEIATHGAGERFVLLDGALRRMVNEVTDIDTVQQVKAVTLNTLLSAVSDLDFTDNAKALRPLSPWRLRALPNTSGDLVITAKRRSRLIARYTSTGTFTPLGEATEAYTLRIYDGVTLVRTESLTTPAYTYAAADIASDGFGSGDPLTLSLVQLSETVGEGDAATTETTAP